MDTNKCDLSVEARVGQLRVVALFLFVNRLLGYLKQFDVSKKAIESAKKSAQERATAAMSAVSCVLSQIRMQFLSIVHDPETENQTRVIYNVFTQSRYYISSTFSILRKIPAMHLNPVDVYRPLNLHY